MSIDWEQLAQRIDSLSDPGVGRDAERARRALVVLLGERMVLDVQSFALSGEPGYGLARLVFQVLSPWEVQGPEGSGATLAEAISPGGAIVDQAVDWRALARSLGTVHARGESVSLEDALFAIETILGEELIRAAVDDYVALRPGRGLARAILQFLGSKAAVWRCQEICKTGESLGARAEALELLCLVADVRAIPWIEEFLDVPETRLQDIMARHLTDLARGNHLNDTARRLLPRLEGHPNSAVREAAVAFRDFFQRLEQEDD